MATGSDGCRLWRTGTRNDAARLACGAGCRRLCRHRVEGADVSDFSTAEIVVDLDGLLELSGRLYAAGTVLEEVCGELRSVGGLAVGAQAVHDAVSDLAVSWDRSARALVTHARSLARAVHEARQQYEACETRVGGLAIPAWGPG